MSESSRLFALPYEIRDQIYEVYLSHEHGDFTDTIRPQALFLDRGAPHSRPLPSLMLTCKRAYREMRAAVHHRAVMRVEMHGRFERRIGFAVHGTLRLSRLRNLWLVIPLERPNWNRWLYFFAEVLRCAPGLEALVIDWSPRPVLPADGWAGRLNRKKEDELFRMIGGLQRLHTVRIHGNVSPRWIDKLREVATRVVHDPSRWWREPGLDS
ncbi:hypothetical protein F5Y17DRAFT_273072 [Xylariaceae sp. FL0594]|nr:hypothetical protein F5Y17DRAFT_273072 [Xylariaceae sp. FL0594]